MSFCPPVHSHNTLLLFVFYRLTIIHKANKYLYFSTNIMQNTILNVIRGLYIPHLNLHNKTDSPNTYFYFRDSLFSVKL
ncbi:hypothetical protein F8161_02825 [Bacillus cereus]|uniref:Uncharacterized protein n=2 Tax=Bacillus cereus group TaxID=86661 RepID=A0A9W7Q4H7_BACCE|nr:hypothetical protein DOS87_10165 [Bacillus sp. CR71]AXR22192.1 hypothetical protein DPQ26_10155 [Bacillus sp. E25]AZV65939.1 hypothetical protein DT426_09755 [Bacillus cereus]EAO56100.1 hypothetical protein RBTH_06135 [Bacillus thuringiensis serovar israelensis ATCC 35646]KAA0797759.1 hypothetical protein DN406_08885 [Bacillus sp. BB56-3]KAA0810453.1 hypothetical protein DN403_28890 [Bacillus sp. AY2-1]KAA8489747.1 hypothetical protein FYW98_03340 [Bacillus thuringiensis]RUR63588.1 hypoth